MATRVCPRDEAAMWLASGGIHGRLGAEQIRTSIEPLRLSGCGAHTTGLGARAVKEKERAGGSE